MHEILAFFVIFLVFTSAFVFVKPANSQTVLQTIFIQPDGSVYPDAAPIQRSGNTYIFTDNIYAAVKILKSNITLDGGGHMLSGPYNGSSSDIWVVGSGPNKNTLAQYVIGVDLSNSSVNGVTIENLNIMNFSIGMYIWTKNNTVIGNAVSDNIVGILLSGSNTTVTKNYISSNSRGLFFGFATGGIPNDIYIYANDFEKNNIQLNGCTCKEYNSSEPVHDWDFGKTGNYWSDYNGTDINHDEIGDSPYTIDILNRDLYPMMQSPVKPSVPAPTKISLEAVVLGISAPALLITALFALKQNRKRKNT
jgi:parallel beta-helix repeat protein